MEETSEYGVLGRHQPCSEERVEVLYQTRSNAIILHETLPAYCIPKIVRMETGRVIFEKIQGSPRPPPKISFKHDRMRKLGSEVVRQPEGEVVQQSKSSQSSQPNPNPDQDRTVKHVVCPQRRASRSQEIETRSFREEAVKHGRTEKSVVCRDENHELSMLNEDASTSEYPDCHILLWNKLTTIVFVSLSSRSRTTLTDQLFNTIYNKIMPTTHLVINQRKWLWTWTM